MVGGSGGGGRRRGGGGGGGDRSSGEDRFATSASADDAAGDVSSGASPPDPLSQPSRGGRHRRAARAAAEAAAADAANDQRYFLAHAAPSSSSSRPIHAADLEAELVAHHSGGFDEMDPDEAALLAVLSKGGDDKPPFENIGTIKSFDTDRGFGFISCQETWDVYNADVFIHKKLMNGFRVGDLIRFQVRENSSGQPQASSVRAFDDPGAATDLAKALLAPLRGDDDLRHRLFHGVIKKFNEDRGFGFIDSSDFGQDVFVHATEVRDFNIGDSVAFRIKVRKGKPQALDLRATEEDDNRLVHQGVVKRVDEAKGYGFISCQLLFDIYGADVFVTTEKVKGFSVGDAVTFSVQVDSKGRPQAVELIKSEGGGAGDDEEDEHAERCLGTIKSYNTEQGYGFITGAETMERYGRDVFLHAKQIKEFGPGDTVSFAVRIVNGRPQAHGLREPRSLSWLGTSAGGDAAAAPAGGDEGAAAGSGSGGDGAGGAAEDGVEDREYSGEIKSFSSAKGYGFIHCAELIEKFGRDVFIHQAQFEGLHVGDRVRFRAQVKRGQPQARDVAAVSAAAPANGEASAATDAAEAEQLNRRLLRACASARAESPALVAELLAARADPNVRDVTGQTPIMIAALNVRHSEKKCKHLIACRADLDAPCSGDLSAIAWARQRINRKFAAFLEAAQRGEALDEDVPLEAPADDF